MSINPSAALSRGFRPNENARPNEVAGPNEGEQVLLETYNVGPSSRDGGPLRKTDTRLTIIRDGLTDVGGYRPRVLPDTTTPFHMPKEHAFALPVTIEVLNPDILSATDLVAGYTTLFFSVSNNSILAHGEALVDINPSKTSYIQVMNQIINAATRLTGLSLTSHPQDWMWVVLVRGPLFQERVTSQNWDEVWPLLGHQTFRLMIYLIEVCPEGSKEWDTWQRPLIV